MIVDAILLARAGRAGGVAPAVFNAANEQAVALFLERRITFNDISRAIGSALDTLAAGTAASRDAVLAADADARRHVRSLFSC